METSRSSSSFSYQRTYDVFLSFRGEDTRAGFTGNLYHALNKKGVKTFIDDRGLEKGEEIIPTIMKLIQESRSAIVIFSKNYASSTFCLQELVKIMECFDHKGMLVLPVFYHVDPSDVRSQKGSYGEALTKHETAGISNKDEVRKWRLALRQAADISGWHYNQGYEYEYIEKIIQEISKRINRSPLPLYVANYPVRKTTLSCAAYNSIAHQSEGLSLLEDTQKFLHSDADWAGVRTGEQSRLREETLYCDRTNVKKGPWSPEEDKKLKEYIEKHGTGGKWIALPKKAGLKRCGKSCRHRWLNYLRPNLKHEQFSEDEDLHSLGKHWKQHLSCQEGVTMISRTIGTSSSRKN